jgi:hypothetical protein
MSRHPVRSPLAGLVLTREDRALVKHVAAAQRRALAARAEDAARREITRGRMADTATLTYCALHHGVGIAAHVEAEAHARPFAAAAVAQLGTVGIQQLERHLRSYGEDS